MSKQLKMIIYALITVFILFCALYMANTPKYVKSVEGVVISKDSTGVNVKSENGEVVHLGILEYSVGQEVNVSVYKRGLTGTVSYRSLKMTQLL